MPFQNPFKIHFYYVLQFPLTHARECVRILDLRVQVHPGELWVSKQRVHIALEASKSAGAKGDVPKICGFVHPLHPCYSIPWRSRRLGYLLTMKYFTSIIFWLVKFGPFKFKDIKNNRWWRLNPSCNVWHWIFIEKFLQSLIFEWYMISTIQ